MKKTVANEKGKIWLRKETSPYYTRILLLSFLTICATVFSVLFAYTVKYLINSASAGENKELWVFTGLILSFLLLKILLKTLESYFAEKLRAKMTAQLRTKTFSKILRSDYAQVQKYHSGEILTRLTTDIQEVSAYSVSLLPAVSGMIIQCIGAVLALFFIDPYFTLIYIFAGIIFASLTALFRKRLKKQQKEVLEADGAFRSYMQENFSSLLTVKAYSAEVQSTEKAKKLGIAYYQKRMKRNVLHSGMNGIFSLLSNFGLIFALVWCSIDVLNGSTDYGSILSSILLLMQLQTPLSSFSSIPPAYYARQTSGERLAEIDDIPIECCKVEFSSNLSYEKLECIRFQNVDFSYNRDMVLSNVNATIEKGKIICLTGTSGSGKSTIFKLLLHIFSPTAGSISLECAEYSKILTSAERNLFAYVPQGNFLFSGTIYENLTFFALEKEESILQEKIKNALQVACADFVFSLPQGLETVLTERGGGLSEGQLQRLAVARALLSERPILLLDEATSALDPETEKALLQNLQSLKNKTCLIVTHRPAALSIADEIMHLKSGKIQTMKKTEQ